MANLTESAAWESGIYRIELTDPVEGGESGTTNIPIKQLANRTLYLKDVTDTLETTLETTTIESKGSGLARHCVITSKHVANSATADYFNGSTIGLSSGTIQIKATASTPFVASISGGYESGKAITYYAFFDTDQTLAYTGGSDRLICIDIDADGVATLALQGTTSYTISYIAPTSPSNNDLWYDLRRERTFKYSTLAGWVAINQLVIGSFSPTGGDITPIGKVGVGIMSLYGRGDVPAGTVHIFAGTVANIPNGYLLANGSAISRSLYADLYGAVGTTYGVGDGSTTFNVPDLRGEFVRGLDNSRGVDTDTFTLQATTTSGSANITNADTTGLVAGMSISGTGIPGGATISSITNTTTFVISANATATANFVSLTVSKSRTLGTSQADQFKLHTHKYSRLSNAVNSGSPTTAAISDWEGVGNVQSTDNPQPVGGAETRPRNIAMNYIIKF